MHKLQSPSKQIGTKYFETAFKSYSAYALESNQVCSSGKISHRIVCGPCFGLYDNGYRNYIAIGACYLCAYGYSFRTFHWGWQRNESKYSPVLLNISVLKASVVGNIGDSMDTCLVLFPVFILPMSVESVGYGLQFVVTYTFSFSNKHVEFIGCKHESKPAFFLCLYFFFFFHF